MRILSWSVQKLNGNPAGLRQSLILPTGETAFFKDHSQSSTMHSGLFSVLSAMWSVGMGSSFTLRSTGGMCSRVSVKARAGHLLSDHPIYLHHLHESQRSDPNSQPASVQETTRGTHSCTVCADLGAGSVCLFVCLEHTCHSPYLRRRDLGKNCSPDL